MDGWAAEKEVSRAYILRELLSDVILRRQKKERRRLIAKYKRSKARLEKTITKIGDKSLEQKVSI